MTSSDSATSPFSESPQQSRSPALPSLLDELGALELGLATYHFCSPIIPYHKRQSGAKRSSSGWPVGSSRSRAIWCSLGTGKKTAVRTWSEALKGVKALTLAAWRGHGTTSRYPFSWCCELGSASLASCLCAVDVFFPAGPTTDADAYVFFVSRLGTSPHSTIRSDTKHKMRYSCDGMT